MRITTIPLIALAMAMPGSAGAAIVAFVDQDIVIPTTFAGVAVTFETGETGTASAGLSGADANFVLGGLGITNDADQLAAAPTWQPVRSGTGNTDPIEVLAIRTEVGPTSVTSNGFGGSQNHFGPFVSGTRQYLGFTLELEDSTLAYGWAEVTLRDDNVPGVIHSWAFENTGAPILVSEIPEPSQILLLLGGLLVPVFRRSRS